jgi:hypothetical protein
MDRVMKAIGFSHMDWMVTARVSTIKVWKGVGLVLVAWPSPASPLNQ